MKKSIIKTLANNKETIVKKSLILGGAIAGLLLVGALIPDDEETQDEVIDVDTVEEEIEEEVQEVEDSEEE